MVMSNGDSDVAGHTEVHLYCCHVADVTGAEVMDVRYEVVTIDYLFYLCLFLLRQTFFEEFSGGLAEKAESRNENQYAHYDCGYRVKHGPIITKQHRTANSYCRAY